MDENLFSTKATLIALLSLLNISTIHWSLSKNKAACFESITVQSSRSNLKSTTYQKKGRLLRFQSIDTATSDGGAQKLGNNFWHDSESIATKVCSQNCRK